MENLEVKYLWSTPDAEQNILYTARVSSTNKNSTSTRLINYLIKNKHWSPFEMSNLCVEVTGSRAILRQILRHRSLSYQEFSQRYAKVDESSFVVNRARRQDFKNRQNSIDDLSEDVREEWVNKQNQINNLVIESYQWAIDNGIAKECARAILPEGNTLSTLCMNGTIRSWIHYLQLRTENGTQKEHMDIANTIKEVFIEHFPVISEALNFI